MDKRVRGVRSRHALSVNGLQQCLDDELFYGRKDRQQNHDVLVCGGENAKSYISIYKKKKIVSTQTSVHNNGGLIEK